MTPACRRGKRHILIWLNPPIRAFSFDAGHLQSMKHALGSLSDHCTWEIVETEDAMLAALQRAEFVVCWKFKTEWYRLAPQLRMLITPAAGRDWIDPPPSERDITVIHGTFHGLLMRETLLLMMLAFNSDFPTVLTHQQNRLWERDFFSGHSRLAFQTVTFWGYGRIAGACAHILTALGARVIGVRRRPETEFDPLGVRLITPDQLTDYLPQTDHLVSVLPGEPTNTNIIDARIFSQLKPQACFYNLGRGCVCDEQALLNSLDSGCLKGAGLDVFATEPLDPQSRLWDHPRVIIFPHASAICRHYLDLFCQEFAEHLRTSLLEDKEVMP